MISRSQSVAMNIAACGESAQVCHHRRVSARRVDRAGSVRCGHRLSGEHGRRQLCLSAVPEPLRRVLRHSAHRNHDTQRSSGKQTKSPVSGVQIATSAGVLCTPVLRRDPGQTDHRRSAKDSHVANMSTPMVVASLLFPSRISIRILGTMERMPSGRDLPSTEPTDPLPLSVELLRGIAVALRVIVAPTSWP